LRSNIRSPNDNDAKAKERVKDAVSKKKATEETIGEAWHRIFGMKNSEADRGRLLEVKNAMAQGVIGRHPDALRRRFSKAEALWLWRELQEQQKEQKLAELVANTPSNYVLVKDTETLQKMIDDVNTADLIAVDCETYGNEHGDALDPWKGSMAGFSVSTSNRHYYVPLNHIEGTELTEQEVVKAVKKPLEQAKTVMHNASFDCKWFWLKYRINLIDGLHADTRIMAMAFDENRSHRLKDLITDWLKEPSDNFDELFGKTQFNEVPLNVALVYAAGDTEKTLKLYYWIKKWYEKRDDLKRIKRLVFEIEMPVCREFIRADLRGIKFDTERAHELDTELAKEENQLQKDIYKLLGGEINLNSHAQLKEKLFTELKLPDYDKGSTGVKTLKKLKNIHPVIPKILEYREVGKLRQAFTSKLPGEVKADNKIHPWFDTWGAATGRFTCRNPKYLGRV
jgi:DNA polymerase-1